MYFFFFNDTATTEIYTLSLHDALPICRCCIPLPFERTPQRTELLCRFRHRATRARPVRQSSPGGDRKSTRLNSSHLVISYAVFCLKKKKESTYCIISSSDASLRYADLL